MRYRGRRASAAQSAVVRADISRQRSFAENPRSGRSRLRSFALATNARNLEQAAGLRGSAASSSAASLR
eukprot:15340599-Alexandrium_andersonii.AAC.2